MHSERHMTKQRPSLLKRLRPRFSVKTMLVVTLLIAVHFALGTPTKRWGLDDVANYSWQHNAISGHAEYVAPLLVKCESSPLTVRVNRGRPRVVIPPITNYYIWFFGFVLPLAEFEGPIDDDTLNSANFAEAEQQLTPLWSSGRAKKK